MMQGTHPFMTPPPYLQWCNHIHEKITNISLRTQAPRASKMPGQSSP
jgi:hypothetical protein